MLLDLGTGLRLLAEAYPAGDSRPFHAAALITHLHWDHVQGLPFFPHIHQPSTHLDIYGPRQDEGPLHEVFDGLMRPPYFPVQFTQLRGTIEFHDVLDDDLSIGNAKVKVRQVPHVGTTVGYRIEWGGATVAYVSDHQAPLSLDRVADSVLELCDGADLVIHDAQYTPEEFTKKPDWGHCTVDYALLVAREAGAHRLVLFHHDPSHSDDDMDAMVADAQAKAAAFGLNEVVGAYEGLTLTLGST
ncbi:MAG TPA: MBL fold metallo-hydrolase [Acidimicrobiales bacterium]|nr:MBL fold metallo-hydrolase [Acidimicrobiales bacterium]